MPKVLITAKNQIINNMDTIDSYLNAVGTTSCSYARDLINRGRSLAYRIIEGEYRFYPSRFIGYIDENMAEHKSDMGDGKKTNPAITKILKTKLEENEDLEKEYFKYLRKLGLDSYDFKRRYWNIDVK